MSVPKKQVEIMPNMTMIENKSLPKVDFNRQRLQSMVDKILIANEVKNKVNAYLDNIEKHISEINSFQSEEYIEDYYSSMQTAILEIHNMTDTLHELLKPYHLNLPTSIKQLILGWITPLNIELKKRLEMPKEDREELEVKTKHLYAEQSLVSRIPELQQPLMKHLEIIKALFIEPGRPNPRCYISYAWPSKENKEQEYWVQPFLSVLYDHLSAAGIRMVMDIRDNKPGNSIYQFMEQYHDGNYIILVGTESLLQKHYSIVTHAVKTELSIITNRYEQDMEQYGQSRIYPILISGTIKTAYPEVYDKYRTVREGRIGYVESLKKLINWFYENAIQKNEVQYLTLWKSFQENQIGLYREARAVEEELKIGYHRQHLDFLRQDIQYQSVSAQQEVKHSSAVSTEMIGALLKSQGVNPKTLFDEHGIQFQWPYSNPDFIERRDLQEKIKKHFSESEQQILTLTAHGLGGVGKTELAQHFYLHPPRPYSLRVWFYATSREVLCQQYIQLGEDNGIKFSEKVTLDEKVKKIKQWLESQKDCLLIYDNVPDIKAVEGLLPEQGKHHILMTSRNEVDWPVRQKLDVDVMEEFEAIALIRRMIICDENEVKLKELANTLGCLPLALAQAGAYLAVKKMSIEEYLNLYREHKKQVEFLSEVTRRSPKHEPVWITFDMNFEALAKECPAALLTLKQASWLYHSAIPEILLQSIVDDSRKDRSRLWADIKESLSLYSLIRIDVMQHQLNIHSLLQDILHSQQDSLEKIFTFQQVCGAINKLITLDEHPENLLYNQLISHAECLHQHGKKIALLPKINDVIKEPLLLTIEPENLATLYHRMGLSDRGLSFCNEQLGIYKKIHGEIHHDVAWSYNNLGLMHRAVGNANKSIEYYQKAIKTWTELYWPEHVEVATSCSNLGVALLDLGDAEKAKEYHEKAQEILVKIFGPKHLKVAKNLNNFGTVYLALGNGKEAIEYFKKAETILTELYGENHPEIANVYNNLGEGFRFLGNVPKAIEYYQRALNIWIKLNNEEHPKVAIYYNNMGIAWIAMGDAKKAKEYHEKALAIDIKVYNQVHPKLAIDYDNLGLALCALGDINGAMGHHQRALKIFSKLYDLEHPNIAKNYNNLAGCYCALGNVESLNKAIDYSEKALAILVAIYGLEHPDIATSYNNLGAASHDLRNFKESEHYYRMALGLKIKLYGAKHHYVAISYSNLSSLLQDLDGVENIKEAMECSEKAISLLEELYGFKHPDVATCNNILGSAYCLLGDNNNVKKAIECYEKTLAIRTEIYSSEHPSLAFVYNNLGGAWVKLDDITKAINYHEKALIILNEFYGPEHLNSKKSFNNLCSAYSRLNNKLQDMAETNKPTPFSKETSKTSGLSKLEFVLKLNHQGIQYYKNERYDDALEILKQALTLCQIHNFSNSKEEATLQFNIGTVYILLKNYSRAHLYLSKAYESRLKLLGPNDLSTQKSEKKLKECASKLNQISENFKVDKEEVLPFDSNLFSVERNNQPLIFSPLSTMSDYKNNLDITSSNNSSLVPSIWSTTKQHRVSKNQ